MAVRAPLVRAEPGFTLPFFERLAPPPPPALVGARIDNLAKPGDVVLDLAGRGGWVARAAVDRQRRVTSLESSPLTRLLAELVLRPPDLRHLDAAFQAMSASPRGQTSLKNAVGELFATRCATCGRALVADEFLWPGQDRPDDDVRRARRPADDAADAAEPPEPTTRDGAATITTTPIDRAGRRPQGLHVPGLPRAPRRGRAVRRARSGGPRARPGDPRRPRRGPRPAPRPVPGRRGRRRARRRPARSPHAAPARRPRGDPRPDRERPAGRRRSRRPSGSRSSTPCCRRAASTAIRIGSGRCASRAATSAPRAPDRGASATRGSRSRTGSGRSAASSSGSRAGPAARSRPGSATTSRPSTRARRRPSSGSPARRRPGRSAPRPPPDAAGRRRRRAAPADPPRPGPAAGPPEPGTPVDDLLGDGLDARLGGGGRAAARRPVRARDPRAVGLAGVRPGPIARLGRAVDRPRRPGRLPRRRRARGPRRGGPRRRRGRLPAALGAARRRRRRGLRERGAAAARRRPAAVARTRANVTLDSVPGGAGDPEIVPGPGLFSPAERIDRRPFSAADVSRTVVDVAVDSPEGARRAGQRRPPARRHPRRARPGRPAAAARRGAGPVRRPGSGCRRRRATAAAGDERPAAPTATIARPAGAAPSVGSAPAPWSDGADPDGPLGRVRPDPAVRPGGGVAGRSGRGDPRPHLATGSRRPAGTGSSRSRPAAGGWPTGATARRPRCRSRTASNGPSTASCRPPAPCPRRRSSSGSPASSTPATCPTRRSSGPASRAIAAGRARRTGS